MKRYFLLAGLAGGLGLVGLMGTMADAQHLVLRFQVLKQDSASGSASGNAIDVSAVPTMKVARNDWAGEITVDPADTAVEVSATFDDGQGGGPIVVSFVESGATDGELAPGESFTDAAHGLVLTRSDGTLTLSGEVEAGTYSVSLTPEGGPATLLNLRGLELARLSASDAGANDHFGGAVALFESYALIGAWRDDSYRGSAYLFRRDGSNWTQLAKLAASDGEGGDHFGWAVDMSGTTALIGSRYDDDGASRSGSIYVFDLSPAGLAGCGETGNPCLESAKLTASDPVEDAHLGFSLALSGTTLLAGAYQDDDGGDKSGSAYLFDLSPAGLAGCGETGNPCHETAKLTASDAGPWHWFGYAVDLSPDTALISSNYTNSVYLFAREGEIWNQRAKLTASDLAPGDRFGSDVALSASRALVSAPNHENYRGTAYLFDLTPAGLAGCGDTGNPCLESAKLVASDGIGTDNFGTAIALSASHALIGAFGDDDRGSNSGSAYLFDLSSPGLAGCWETGNPCHESAKLTAPDGSPNDLFGAFSVALSDTHGIIGAHQDDGGSGDSGSAYAVELPY